MKAGVSGLTSICQTLHTFLQGLEENLGEAIMAQNATMGVGRQCLTPGRKRQKLASDGGRAIRIILWGQFFCVAKKKASQSFLSFVAMFAWSQIFTNHMKELKGAGWVMVGNGHTLASFVNCAKSNSANSNNVPIKVEAVFRKWAFFSKMLTSDNMRLQ